MTAAAYEGRKQRLVAQLNELGSGPIRLGKKTSNLFRQRSEARGGILDVNDLCNVLEVDARAGWVNVEGMTTYSDLVDATLPHACMPAVVPQLKSITVGGAISGIGIESSSFRYGLPHETVLEMDVLLGNGEIVTCTPDNEHSDLFFAMPNSYGTLGYGLRFKLKTIPVKPFVRLSHELFEDSRQYFSALEQACGSNADFVDGVVFDRSRHYLVTGRFVDQAPFVSDYTYLDIYYRSICRRSEDYLSVHDYIWRWDTDWFWCSKNLLAQNGLVRRLLGRKRLNSIFYTKVMRWNSRWGVSRFFDRLSGKHPESVIQDVDIPIDAAPEFLEFFQDRVGIRPIWICPIGHYRKDKSFPLYSIDTEKPYVNFGFWDVVPNREGLPPGHFNRLVEDEVERLGGIKSLYSDSYYSADDFWRIYNGAAYTELKSRYDPENRLKDLYQKCVLRD